MEIDYYKILDDVLLFLQHNNEFQPNINIVYKGINAPVKLIYIQQALDKLSKDGYAEKINVPFETPIETEDSIQTSMYCYAITFEGELFANEGGYKRWNEIEDIKIKKTVSDTNRALRNDTRLSTWTIVLGIATALLFVLEIIVHWKEIHLFFCGC